MFAAGEGSAWPLGPVLGRSGLPTGAAVSFLGSRVGDRDWVQTGAGLIDVSQTRSQLVAQSHRSGRWIVRTWLSERPEGEGKVRPEGFEPPTYWVETSCSIH